MSPGIVVLALLPHAAVGACPLQGIGGDPILNGLKNRTAVPSAYEPMAIEGLIGLDVPAGVSRRRRIHWPAATRRLVGTRERRGVHVCGYLIDVQPGGRESANCDSRDPARQDLHLWLAPAPRQRASRSQAIIAELTPRVRSGHPRWTRADLHRLEREPVQVCVGGWLMLDEEHPQQVGKTRATLWEIHPVTKIEVRRHRQWRDL